jgi:hypothetical protein
MELSEQLIKTINCSNNVRSAGLSPDNKYADFLSDQILSPTHQAFTDTGNAIRSKIARVLNQIQLATPSTIFLFRPIAVAFQLSLLEHKLLRKIHPADLINHRPPNHPSPSLQASSEFFNYLTRIIELSVLEPPTPLDRSKAIIRWIKVANNLKLLNNLQTLKAVVSALGTPPVARLKRTWAIVKRKPDFNDLNEHRTLMSEQNNYSAYREWIKANMTRPMVPFLGVLIHDTTYVLTIAKKEASNHNHHNTQSSGCDNGEQQPSLPGSSEPNPDKHIQEIQRVIRYCTAGPRYSYEMLEALDMATQAAKKTTLPFRKKIGGGLSEQGAEELMGLKDLDDEEIGTFISHWILSRKWMPEKEVDELSQIREPKVIPHAQPPRDGIPQSVRDNWGLESMDSDKGSEISPSRQEGDISETSGHALPRKDSDESSPGRTSSSPTDDYVGPIPSMQMHPRTYSDNSRREPPAMTYTSRVSNSLQGANTTNNNDTKSGSGSSPPVPRKRSLAGSTSIIGAIRDTAYSFVSKPRSGSGNSASTTFPNANPITQSTKRNIASVDTLNPQMTSNIVVTEEPSTSSLSPLDNVKRQARSLSSDTWSLNSLKSISMEAGMDAASSKRGHTRAESVDGMTSITTRATTDKAENAGGEEVLATELKSRLERMLSKRDVDSLLVPEIGGIPEVLIAPLEKEGIIPATLSPTTQISPDSTLQTPSMSHNTGNRKGSFFGFSMPFASGSGGTNTERSSWANRERSRAGSAHSTTSGHGIADLDITGKASEEPKALDSNGIVTKIGGWTSAESSPTKALPRGLGLPPLESTPSAVAAVESLQSTSVAPLKSSGWGLGQRRQSTESSTNSPTTQNTNGEQASNTTTTLSNSSVGWTKYSTAKSAKAFLSRDNDGSPTKEKKTPRESESTSSKDKKDNRSGSLSNSSKERDKDSSKETKAQKEKERDQGSTLTLVGQTISPVVKPRGFNYRSSTRSEQQQPSLAKPSTEAYNASSVPLKVTPSAYENNTYHTSIVDVLKSAAAKTAIASTVNMHISAAPPPLPPKPSTLSPKSSTDPINTSAATSAPLVPPKPLSLSYSSLNSSK